jgi:hypothetical protein
MSNHPTHFLFHIPNTGKDPFDMKELEKKIKGHNPPKVVDVIETTTSKRLGRMPTSIAITKFR